MKEPRLGFAKSERGLEFALVVQATHKTAAEVYQMSKWDRHLTALLQARYLKEVYGDDGGQQQV